MTKSDLRLYGSGATLYHDDVDRNFQRLTYYSGPWSAGTYEQYEMVGHEGGVWICIAATTTAEPGTDLTAWVPTGTVPGRGGMVKTPDSAGTDIGAGWQALTYDAESIGSYGVTLTPATGLFSTMWAGLWELRFSFAMEHNESNSGRNTNVRLWDVTDGVQIGPLVYIPIGRNQPGTLVALFLNLELTATELGDDLRLEIGGGDAISAITWRTSRLELTQRSPPVT